MSSGFRLSTAIGILLLLLKGLFHLALVLVASFWICAQGIGLLFLLIASHVYTTSISLLGLFCSVMMKLLHGISRIALSLLLQLRGLVVILRFMEATIFTVLNVGSDAAHLTLHPLSYRSLSLSQKAKIALLLVGMVVFISIMIRANLEQPTVLYTPTYSPSYGISRSKHRTPRPESERRKVSTHSKQLTPAPQPQRRRDSGMGIFDTFEPDRCRTYLREHSHDELVQQYHSKQNKVKLSGANLAVNAVGAVAAHHIPPLIPITWRNRSVNKQKLVVIREEMRDRGIQITASGNGWVKAGMKAGVMAVASDMLRHAF